MSHEDGGHDDLEQYVNPLHDDDDDGTATAGRGTASQHDHHQKHEQQQHEHSIHVSDQVDLAAAPVSSSSSTMMQSATMTTTTGGQDDDDDDEQQARGAASPAHVLPRGILVPPTLASTRSRRTQPSTSAPAASTSRATAGGADVSAIAPPPAPSPAPAPRQRGGARPGAGRPRKRPLDDDDNNNNNNGSGGTSKSNDGSTGTGTGSAAGRGGKRARSSSSGTPVDTGATIMPRLAPRTSSSAGGAGGVPARHSFEPQEVLARSLVELCVADWVDVSSVPAARTSSAPSVAPQQQQQQHQPPDFHHHEHHLGALSTLGGIPPSPYELPGAPAHLGGGGGDASRADIAVGPAGAGMDNNDGDGLAPPVASTSASGGGRNAQDEAAAPHQQQGLPPPELLMPLGELHVAYIDAVLANVKRQVIVNRSGLPTIFERAASTLLEPVDPAFALTSLVQMANMPSSASTSNGNGTGGGLAPQIFSKLKALSQVYARGLPTIVLCLPDALLSRFNLGPLTCPRCASPTKNVLEREGENVSSASTTTGGGVAIRALSSNGYKRPRTHPVTGHPAGSSAAPVVLTRRYTCATAHGCKRVFNGTDDVILKQVPEPARSALSARLKGARAADPGAFWLDSASLELAGGGTGSLNINGAPTTNNNSSSSNANTWSEQDRLRQDLTLGALAQEIRGSLRHLLPPNASGASTSSNTGGNDHARVPRLALTVGGGGGGDVDGDETDESMVIDPALHALAAADTTGPHPSTSSASTSQVIPFATSSSSSSSAAAVPSNVAAAAVAALRAQSPASIDVGPNSSANVPDISIDSELAGTQVSLDDPRYELVLVPSLDRSTSAMSFSLQRRPVMSSSLPASPQIGFSSTFTGTRDLSVAPQGSSYGGDGQANGANLTAPSRPSKPAAKRQPRRCVVCLAIYAGPQGHCDQGYSREEVDERAHKCPGRGGRHFCPEWPSYSQSHDGGNDINTSAQRRSSAQPPQADWTVPQQGSAPAATGATSTATQDETVDT